MDESNQPLIHRMRKKATGYHEKIPYLRKLPGSALAIVLFLVSINLLVWTACAIVLHFHTSLVSTAVLAYTLGLRHALDADHIAAIDLCTRRLVASGQRPVTVGTFFSLGHSTIVIVTSIVVAASSAAISSRFDAFGNVGGIIGSSVSSAFLIILGSMNAYILYKLLTTLLATIRCPIGHETTTTTTSATTNLFPATGGCMTSLPKKLTGTFIWKYTVPPNNLNFNLFHSFVARTTQSGLPLAPESTFSGIASVTRGDALRLPGSFSPSTSSRAFF
jgi:high-affinity nickel-transport protein